MVASTRTAIASPTPSCLMARTSPAAKPAKTMTMRSGGGGDDAGRVLEADGDGEVVVAGFVVHFLTVRAGRPRSRSRVRRRR